MLAADIMKGGISAGTARALQGVVASSITAAGTVITDATDLVFSINPVTTVAANSGVQLPLLQPNESVLVYNQGANMLRVYPGASTVAINSLTAGNPHTLATNTACTYTGITSTLVVGNLSA